MEKTLARIFSIVFHPLMMTSLGMLIVFNSGTALSVLQTDIKRVSMVVTVLFTFVFPALMILLFAITKVIGSVEMKERRERVLPFLLIILFYLFTFFMMRGIPQLSKGHIVFLFCPAVALFLAMIFNNIMKISIHMLAIGGLLGLLLALIMIYAAPLQHIFIAVLVCSGLLGTSRLILEENTPREIYSGFGTGFVTAAIILFISLP